MEMQNTNYSSDEEPQTNFSQSEAQETRAAQQVGDGTSKIGEIDMDKDRYPLSITWTALPGITWFLPFIGHTGIACAQGKIYDFAGPYYI